MTIGLVVITVARHISYSLVNREVGTLGEGGTSLSMRLNVQKLLFFESKCAKTIATARSLTAGILYSRVGN